LIFIDKIKKILEYLPSYPHYKMNIFCGTNNLQEITSAFRLLKNGASVSGSCINEYERILKDKLKSKYIYTFASGRMGFYSILKIVGVKKGDEVIIPSFTCVVVPNAILYCDAKPIYCDINKDDFNINLSKIESLITPNTKILYAQHTFGQMCDISSIMDLAKKYNLIVVEDAALSLGAKLDRYYSGTIADFGYFSTDRSKIVNTGLGGIVSVNNAIYVDKFIKYYADVPYVGERYTRKIFYTFILNLITLHPYLYWLGKFINAILTKLNIMKYFLDEKITDKAEILDYPYPSKLSNIFASIGVTQIIGLNYNIKSRKKIANFYNEILKIYTNHYIYNEENVFLRYGFLVKNRDYWETRFAKNIDLSIWFKTVASGRQTDFNQIYYKVGSNVVSEYVCDHIFNLPTHNLISPERLKVLLVELKNSGDIITKERVL
jgi:perosamine synthetase